MCMYVLCCVLLLLLLLLLFLHAGDIVFVFRTASPPSSWLSRDCVQADDPVLVRTSVFMHVQ